MASSSSNIVPASKFIMSPGLNKCGLKGNRIYIPAFKTKNSKTVDEVIPHWTPGVTSFFPVPLEFTQEWFYMLVNDANDIYNRTRFVYRDGDSFIENILIPNVEQICINVCIPRGNLDGSLIEMFIAGASMSTSEPVLKTWQKLVIKTIHQQTAQTAE